MKIACIMFDGLTAVDLVAPANVWGMHPEIEIQTVALKAGPIRSDFGMELVASHDFSSCWQQPDVIMVPGGGRPVFQALQDDTFLDAVAALGANSSWVTSVCTGSLILGAAGLLRGYKAASYWYARDYLSLFGAEPVADRVVIDRNRASGGGMTAGIDFALHMLGTWFDEQTGQMFELLSEYAPQPPFKCGRPELASAELVAAATALTSVDMPRDMALAASTRRNFVT